MCAGKGRESKVELGWGVKVTKLSRQREQADDTIDKSFFEQ